MHSDQIERYGGSHGVRAPGLLEAAPFRPQTGYYADLIQEAAALWESRSQNHPFINGARLTADAQEVQDFVLRLYEGNQFTLDNLVPWLREHVEFGSPANADKRS